jgi:hypothetical protein
MKPQLDRFIRTSRLGRLVTLLLAVSLLAVGCDSLGCGSSGSADRAGSMAERLPANSDLALVVADLSKMRTSLETTRDLAGEAFPMAELVQEQAKNELGIDVFDAESWDKTGIDKDGGLALGFVGKHPVVVTFVSDKQKFEKAFSDQIKKSFDIEAAAKSESIEGADVKLLGEDPAQATAWAYTGKQVVIGFPVVDEMELTEGSEQPENVQTMVANLINLDKKESLAKLPAFEKFNKALASGEAMALFLNSKKLLTEERVEDLKSGSDPIETATIDWMQENVEAMGFAMTADGNSMKIRGWFGLPEDVAKRAGELMTPPADAPVANFATENTMAALRISVDMPKLWAFYKETLPEEELEKITAELDQAAKTAELDFEEDIINKLTGNISVLFYGVDKEVLDKAGGNLMRAFMMDGGNLMALMVPVQFDSSESLEKVVDALMGMVPGDGVERTEIADGVDVLKMKNVAQSPGQFFVKDDLLVFGTSVFSNESGHQYITGNRDEEQIEDVDALNLGKEFATEKSYNGLYLNFVRAKNHLGDALQKEAPQAVAFLDKLEEASLTSKVDDTGAFLDLTIDLNAEAAKADKADKSDDE